MKTKFFTGYKLLAFGLLLLLTDQVAAQPAPPKFELKDGDRVVFVGNSLFENDLQYGYLEMALTTRFPDRQVTFRNIGWTGDTVFGESRNYITNPPTPYELLLQQLTDARPTVVFVAYGGIEAQAGEEGLPRFTDGLNKLLDKIADLGAKAILLSPIPVLGTGSLTKIDERNAILTRYADVIASTAAERGSRYIDFFGPIQQIADKASITENGIHLNEHGYYLLAEAVQKALGLAEVPYRDVIRISKKGTPSSATARLSSTTPQDAVLRFELDQKYLPIPRPASGTVLADRDRVLQIDGLTKGTYALSANGTLMAVGSAATWAKGIALDQGPPMTQAAALQEADRRQKPKLLPPIPPPEPNLHRRFPIVRARASCQRSGRIEHRHHLAGIADCPEPDASHAGLHA